MKSFLLFCVVSLYSLECTATQEPVAAEKRLKRPVSVVDSIQSTMTTLDDYRFPAGVFSLSSLAHFSPDGKKFIVVLRKGNLKKNTNEYSMLLFRVDEVFQSPKPQVLLKMASSSNREAIKDVLWLDDNDTIAFLGENPGEKRQLYTFSVRTGILRKRSHAESNIASFSMTANGDKFAIVAEEPITTIFDEQARRDGFVVSKEDWLTDLLMAQRGGLYGNAQLLFQSGDGPSRPMEIVDRISEWSTLRPFLSPDGKYIVIALQVADIPASWQDYSDAGIRKLVERKPARTGYWRYSQLRRYVLVDTATGRSHALLDSPLGGGAPQVAWSPDSHSVAISDVYLPLGDTDGDERKIRQSTTFAVEVKVPDGETVKITQEKVKVLGWDAKKNRVIFEAMTADGTQQSSARVSFEKHRHAWGKVTGEESDDGRPTIAPEEDMNTAPRIFAIDPPTHRKVELLDLNPQFTDLKFGKVKEIKWKATDGHEVSGGLFYPVDYLGANRYPLVIQTHGWEPDKFMIDGPFPTGFAAQELAGKGIMVVQCDEGVGTGYIGTPKEAPGETAVFEGVIDYLDKRGMIDRQRVGIIGFSRTVFHVKYTLTHSKYAFAAAAITDGFDGGYTPYLLAGPLAGDNFEGVNGGAPFGEGLKLWVERSPEFGLENIQTPLRIVSENRGVTLIDYPWYSASVRLGKLVEMVIMPDGEHYLRKPWERMVDSQGNVDWFCFWLKGEEDPDPAKAEQYARWRELRKLQEQNARQPQRANPPSVH